MTQLLPLRDYQEKCITAVRRAWQKHDSVAAVLPTGAGKTVVMSHLAARNHAETGQRALVLVHTQELIGQTLDKFRQVAPHLRAGAIQGQRDEHDADLIVATVQTLRSEHRLARLGTEPMLKIVDECHHAVAKSYRTVLDALPGLQVGFTATLSRSDGEALGEVFRTVAYRRDIIDMIKERYLVPIVGVRVRIPDLDLGKAKMSHGDYQADDLADALSDSLAPELTAKAYAEHGLGRKAIGFAPTVESAYEFAQAFTDAGIATEVVHGALPTADRRAILHRLHTGETTVVWNCMVLTEGFDEPSVSCVIIARPTTSQGLYVQMAGRGLRIAPGKSNCLLLDVVGVTGRHRLAGPVDLIGDKSRREAELPEDLTDFIIDEDGLGLGEPELGPDGAPGRELTYAYGDRYESKIVDLFAASHSAWLRTAGGAWFLSAGGNRQPDGTYGPQLYVALIPNGERFNVGVMNTAGAGEMRYRAVDLDTAMAWGEEVAKETGASALINRKAAWRKPAQQPTDRQIGLAARLRIPGYDRMTKAELSDAITQAKASPLIDRVLGRM